MAAGALFALTLPGLVLLLVGVAVVEQILSRRSRRSMLTGRRRSALSASGLDVFSAALMPGRAADLEEQQARSMRFDDVGDAAPPRGRIDRTRGSIRL